MQQLHGVGDLPDGRPGVAAEQVVHRVDETGTEALAAARGRGEGVLEDLGVAEVDRRAERVRPGEGAA
ncbi:hypothetical protein [Janibacter melonis]|uniref:hypothetical protein n=1 Tax=Janibacter melonis TaxID=262209 RepID=UPI002095C03B|nr:hypothetical protein [Janibacter melonis]